MTFLYVTMGVILFLALITLIASYICFRMTFYYKDVFDENEFSLPDGEIYKVYRDVMYGWAKEVKGTEKEIFKIKSFDGLTLVGKYYEYKKGAPIELMMHGYKGRAERDLCGGVQRCFSLGRNALIVDQRACGRSEGRVVSFGINEKRDCLAWIDFLNYHFGRNVKIILTGISMGASTVLMAAGEELPENVVGVLADCGFTSAKEIIKKTIRDMKLPANLLYPFVKLGAKLFGKFDLEKESAIESVKKMSLPVIFFHGEADDFVPCDMSKENYEACASPKRLVTVAGAGHGLGFLVDQKAYLEAMAEFFTQNGIPTKIV